MRTQSEWNVEISGLRSVRFPSRAVGPLLHLAGRLVGERDGQDAVGGRAMADQLGDAVGDHAGLAGAGAGQDQQRAGEGLDGVVLGGIQVHDWIVSGVAAGRKGQFAFLTNSGYTNRGIISPASPLGSSI